MLAAPKDFDLLPTVSPAMLRKAINDLLKSEPEWIDRAIEHDFALWNRPRREVEKELLLYQGLHAIALHRKAHALYVKGKRVEARSLAQAARRITAGVEIHPGAQIGRNFFIDHGTGIVIGEAAIIGDDVMFYHRVTLGSDGKPLPKGQRRHPKLGNRVVINTGAELLGASTIGDDVVIGAGAKIIGSIKVGKAARIGPELVIRKDVPEKATVIGYNPQTFDLVFR